MVCAMTELMRIIQAHLDRYGVSRAEFARRAGTTPQTVNNWRHQLKSLPDAAHLRGVAEVTGVPYLIVLDAALVDAGYRDSMVDDPAALTAGIRRAVEVDSSVLHELAVLVTHLRSEHDAGQPAATADPAPLDDAETRAVADMITRILRRDLERDGGHDSR